jgi:hypothetical protein
MRAAWVLVAAVLLGACGGGAGNEASRDTSAAAAPAPPVAASADRGPGPSATEAGVPVGYEQSSDGAAAAATTYLSTLHQLVTAGDPERRAALGVLRADGADAVTEEATAAFATLDSIVSRARSTTPAARLFLREVPMAYTVSRFADTRAQVDVWSVGIVIVEGATQATEVWSTNTVELVWEHGDWKVWSWTRRAGPQPSLATTTPVPAAEVLDAIEGWEGYRYVPAA